MDHQNRPFFYQTGYTQPPKSYGGIIAILLIVIVILGSIVTVLGLLNIQLFRKLTMQSEETSSVRFAQLSSAEARTQSADTNALGLSVKTLSVFDKKFYHLPQGVYITDVAPGSSAAKQGVLPGDILLSVQNISVTDAEVLESYLQTCLPGQLINAVIFRDGRQYAAVLTVGGYQ